MPAKVQVVIVGAGPAGLATALELGSRGISCLLVEQNDRVGTAPRAKTVNVRTRTHLRRWHIAQNLADEAPFGCDYPTDVHFVTKLGGVRLAKIENASNCAPARSELYPEHGQWIPQYRLERVMRARLADFPSVEVRFGTRYTDATQTADGVEVGLASENGETFRVACAFLVGADGARSQIRDGIGAVMEGQYGLSRNYNIVFRAPDLAASHPHGPGAMYWQIDPLMPSLIGPMDRDDLWFFMPTRIASDVHLSDEQAVIALREATGIDTRYEIVSRDEWVASSLLANRYRAGRIFLVGDACHLHPPFGGFGMNMGVADGVDLGWKIAAVLQGWGGMPLLDSYEVERRPVHQQVIAEAVSNHAVLSNDLWRDGIENDDAAGERLRAEVGDVIREEKTKEFNTLGTVLGYHYDCSPVIASEAGDWPKPDGQHYQPSTRPGALAPHAWFCDDTSLYDHFGHGFTLLIGRGAADDAVTRAVHDIAQSPVPVAVVDLRAESAAAIYDGLLVLVRPDQHVAWRGTHWRDGVIGLVAGQDRPD